MTDEQKSYIDRINTIPPDEILIKDSGWEVIDLPEHSHTLHQIVHTLSGTLRIQVDEICYFVPERHLAWIPPGVEHRLSSNNRQVSLQIICCSHLYAPRDIFAVYNTSSFIGDNLKFIGSGGTHIKKSEEPEMYSYIISFLNLFPVKGEKYRIPLKALFEPHDSRLREILRYIDSHIGDSIHKEMLAERFGMSVRSLSRLFRASDIRFTDYLSYQRVTRAIELIADRDMSIEQIAYTVGFNSPNHFNRVFRQLMGRTPGSLCRR